MELRRILSACDHTLLAPDATRAQILALCDEAVEYKTASVCIPAGFVREASEYLAFRVPVCTVIGFPTGYSTACVKAFEAEDALKNGAKEIDTVIPIGKLKDGQDGEVLEELRTLKRVCGENVLKVIIETCLLTREEKLRACRIVSESGADFIKTSTGFSRAGATREDVKLLRENVAPHVRVKAAGGISTLTDAWDFLTLGADRLGTSRIVKLVKADESLRAQLK